LDYFFISFLNEDIYIIIKFTTKSEIMALDYLQIGIFNEKIDNLTSLNLLKI